MRFIDLDLDFMYTDSCTFNYGNNFIFGLRLDAVYAKNGDDIWFFPLQPVSLSRLAQVITRLTYIRDVPCSSTAHTDQHSDSFPQSFQANAGIIPSNRPQSLLPPSFPDHHT